MNKCFTCKNCCCVSATWKGVDNNILALKAQRKSQLVCHLSIVAIGKVVTICCEWHRNKLLASSTQVPISKAIPEKCEDDAGYFIEKQTNSIGLLI